MLAPSLVFFNADERAEAHRHEPRNGPAIARQRDRRLPARELFVRRRRPTAGFVATHCRAHGDADRDTDRNTDDRFDPGGRTRRNARGCIHP